jgi:hypothetical protein
MISMCLSFSKRSVPPTVCKFEQKIEQNSYGWVTVTPSPHFFLPLKDGRWLLLLSFLCLFSCNFDKYSLEGISEVQSLNFHNLKNFGIWFATVKFEKKNEKSFMQLLSVQDQWPLTILVSHQLWKSPVHENLISKYSGLNFELRKVVKYNFNFCCFLAEFKITQKQCKWYGITMVYDHYGHHNICYTIRIISILWQLEQFLKCYDYWLFYYF